MIIITSELRLFRINARITQQELADELNVSRQTISNIENRNNRVSLHLAYKCAKYFNTNIEDMFNFNEQ